jgi:phytoene dehydrogenase-like protein
MPLGVENTIQRLKLYFPACAVGIDEYFSLIAKVCDKTFSMDLRKISLTPDVMDEDFVSLKSVLDRLFSDDLLKGLLAIYCSCHGTRPSQVSFANHARVVYSMYQSVARVKDGGNAFIGVFKDKFKALGVDVQCGRHIVECADIKDDLVGTFILDDSSRISAQHCLFTIHPKAVLKILPRKHLSKAFVDRVSEFEASCGFFSVFGTLEGPVPVSHVDPSITSLFPSADVDEMLDPAYRGQPALVVMTDKETLAGADRRLVNAFAVSFWEHVKDWEASRLGDRPKEYLEYKKAATEDIRRRMYQACPYFEGSFKLLDSASMLTFRDYLNTPDGSAYGIKQKIGQFNLFGKLPLRNLYACGQSAVLPGLVGAMMSSFVVARALIGKEEYSRFIEDRLCRQNA